MRVRPGTTLLKDLVVNENLIPIFQCYRKHFFDINSMIDCSFIQDYQRCYTLGTDTQPDHYFLWEFLHLIDASRFIGISTIYCQSSIILKVIDTINVEKLLIGKKILMVPSSRKFVLTQFAIFFRLILWSSKSNSSMIFLQGRSPRSFYMIRRTLISKISSSIAIFQADTLFFGVNDSFLFGCCSLFWRYVEVLIELIIWSSLIGGSFGTIFQLFLKQFPHWNHNGFSSDCHYSGILKVRSFEGLYFSLFKTMNFHAHKSNVLIITWFQWLSGESLFTWTIIEYFSSLLLNLFSLLLCLYRKKKWRATVRYI